MTGHDRQIVLINSNRMQPPIAPIGLDYVGQALARHGFAVDLLDLCFASDWRAEIETYFRGHRPLAVGISIRNTDDAYFASQDFFLPGIGEIIAYVKERTDAPVVLGGVGYSLAPEEILRYCGGDYGIRGEGEVAFPMLLERVSEGTDVEDVPGAVFRVDGEVRSTPPTCADLGDLSAQTRQLVDNPRYFSGGGQAGFETRRGCDRACIYCADPVAKGHSVRTRPAAYVADEIEALFSQGVNCLHTCDCEFNLPETHALHVCEEMVRRGLREKVRWYAYASPKPFSRELAALMKRAGCVGVNFGVDSGSDEQLNRLGRDHTVEDVRRAAERCREHGIVTMFDLLLGGPGETRESLRKTVRVMKEIRPDRVGVSFGVRVYPGTPFAEEVRRAGPFDENPNLRGALNDNPDLLVPLFYMSEELGPDAETYLSELIRGDRRFFFVNTQDRDANYNYNQNEVLVRAIQQGERGAYWDILRRLQERDR